MRSDPGSGPFLELSGYELRDSVESFRFRALATVIVVVMMTTATIYSVRYRTESERYRELLALEASAYQGLTIAELASHIHSAVKPPWRLAFLADGEQSQSPDVFRHAVDFVYFQPELSRNPRPDNRLREVEPLDWLYCLRVVLPLAAFLLAYDAVCAVRQRKRLQLLYSFAVPRFRALAGKLLALWISVVLPFLAGGLLSLSIVSGYGTPRFSGAEILKIGGIVLLGLWAAAIFVCMALTVSALHRESSHSLLTAALLWLTAVVVVPAAGSLSARLARPLPSEGAISRQMGAIDREIFAEEGFGTWRRPDYAKLDGYARERRSAELEKQRFERKEVIRRNLVRDQLEQVELARRLASLSPMFLVKDLGERLAGTGPARDRRFLEAAWAFQKVMTDHVLELDSVDPESPHIPIRTPRYITSLPIRPEDVPRFSFAESTVAEGLHSAAVPAAFLALWTVVMAFSAAYTWSRYDVG